MTLESVIGVDEFMSDIDGMYAFINEYVTLKEEEDVWEETYHVLPGSPEIDDAVDQ